MAETKTKSLSIKDRGIDAASKYLENKGYEVLDKKWKCKIGTVDIIGKDDDTIVFVEVKTKTNVEAGLPEDKVTASHRKKYETLAAMYLQKHDYVDLNIRFDVIGIMVLKKDKAFIRHHVNAFGVGN